MSRYRILTIFLFILIIALSSFLLAQSEFIIIDNSEVFKSKERTSVKFPHMNHMCIEGVSCTECHHRFKNGKNVVMIDELTEKNKSIMCGYCHKGKSELIKAYHHQCIGCHNLKIKGRAKGPRMCGECHIIKK